MHRDVTQRTVVRLRLGDVARLKSSTTEPAAGLEPLGLVHREDGRDQERLQARVDRLVPETHLGSGVTRESLESHHSGARRPAPP